MDRWSRRYPGRRDMLAAGPRAPTQQWKLVGLTLSPGQFGPTGTRQTERAERSRQAVACRTRGWMLRSLLQTSSLRRQVFAKKVLKYPRTFLGEYSGAHLRSMIQLRMPQQISNRAGHPGFLIPRAENNPLHPGQDNSASTHRARLQRDVESAVV